jgi:hypothetical protein
MTDPTSPQYPYYQPPPAGPGYPSGPASGPGYPPPPAPRGPGLWGRLGERAVRRPEPRLGVSLAGAGIALAVLGVLVWGGDYLTSGGGGAGGGGDGSSRRLLGVVLSLAVVVAGYALAIRARRGPLAAAGVAASALGVPVLMGFLTFDTTHSGSGPPFALDALVLVSVLVWLISYLVVPGTRGHAFYVGLATVAIWIYLLDKAEPHLFGNAFVGFIYLFAPQDLFGGSGAGPDWTTVSVLCLVFGLGYYAAVFVLDHTGRPGPGAALAVAGFLATASGASAAAVNLPAVGLGVLLIVLGLILAYFASRSARRFTTWAWSAGVALGVSVIIGKLADQNSAAAGVALILCGAVVVLAGHVLTSALHEPDDIIPTARGVPALGDGQIQ